MGSGHSQSRFGLNLSRHPSGNSSRAGVPPQRGSKYAPENRVLPPSDAPQRLRSTDNGMLLHNGGTISGRKVTSLVHSPETEPEFVRLLQRKTHEGFYAHRKAHSDPDIVRMMLTGSEEESDDDQPRNRRSIIAMSPSKARIKSRKKKKAPEPPQCNTLPRTIGRAQYPDEVHRPQSANEYNETPRRPLPPIPPEEMPPPPPPPPPDYNRSSEDVSGSRSFCKKYEKNGRTVDKWKVHRPNEDDEFPRQRCKSLDRFEEQRMRESLDNRNHRNSLRNDTNEFEKWRRVPEGNENRLSGVPLKDAILEAAKKRSERLQRTRECRNSSFKLSLENPRNISILKEERRNESSPVAFVPNHNLNQNKNDNFSFKYDNSKEDPERPPIECSNNQNFFRRPPVHKQSRESWKELIGEYTSRNDRYPQKEIQKRNSLKSLEREQWDSMILEPTPRFMPEGAASSSSSSEGELEIDLQLRPTLPRRPVEVSRFSPTDVWKSINLDFFKSHQHRSDVSSDDADDIMEEKIYRINRPVAPPKIVHDRSGDSGISPDAGSPMFNESLDVVLNNSSPHSPAMDESNGLWIPQHDLEDSDCDSEGSVSLQRHHSSKSNLQAKFSMPNFMFPSRSLPRTNQRSDLDVPQTAEKSKHRNRGRRKKINKNSDGQHFNSLRNLKKALGLKQKPPVDESNGLDSNWSLSRSLPNFINNLKGNIPIKEEHFTEKVVASEQIQRSDSGYQDQIVSEFLESQNHHNNITLHPQWRKSFPCQASEGHFMYLPEYRSANIMSNGCPSKTIEDRHINTDSELITKKRNSKKKFTYQSTVRIEEKKRLEEKLASEAEAREKKRQEEIEWMNKVEDEFRKQRDKEKVNIRHQLRILNLQEKSSALHEASLKDDPNEIEDNVVKQDSRKNKHETKNAARSYGNAPLYQTKVHEWKTDSSYTNGPEQNNLTNDWQQPTGMKKWLKRQSRDQQHLSHNRPEPEGGRSSSDDCKQIDSKMNVKSGRNRRINQQRNAKDMHGLDCGCPMCSNKKSDMSYNIGRTDNFERPDFIEANSSGRIPNGLNHAETTKCTREMVHTPTEVAPKGNGCHQEPVEEYELHTRLCRSNSGRTFESHSYYARERRQRDERRTPELAQPVFSSDRFERELRKKTSEKRPRNIQEYDSDESAENASRSRAPKKKEPSFSRNHPHRNGARIKPQPRAAPLATRSVLQQVIPTC